MMILCEIGEKDNYYMTSLIENLNYDTNELIYKTETRLTDIETSLWLPKGKEEGDKLGVRDKQIHLDYI